MSRRKPEPLPDVDDPDSFWNPMDSNSYDELRLTDYRIRIECPVCGGAVGFVTKREHRPEEAEDTTREHAHADVIAWPARALVEREIAKVMRKPRDEARSGHGADGWHGRTGRVRAARVTT